MRITNIKIDNIIPYENNPRHNDEAVEYVKNSIKEFGFKVPIVIDKNNVIVTGHTRYKACKELGIATIPCIRADDLTDEQIKAFRVADNSVAAVATWDYDKLEIELQDLDIDFADFALDMEQFDHEAEEMPEEEDNGYYGDERERTNKEYNMDLVDEVELTKDFWQMPIIKKETFIPSDLIGFNYAMTSENKDCGIHCFVDDYQFERLWNSPEQYIDTLKEYECFLSPDFSLYMDMTRANKIWNIYRSRLIGAFYQARGIKVIPTISWAEKETFEFCFKGLQKGGVVAVSTIGVKEHEEALQVWKDGMEEMIKQIKPKTILVYGGKLDFDYGKIKVVYFENKVTERMSGKAEV